MALLDFHGYTECWKPSLSDEDILELYRPRDVELYGWCVVVEENSFTYKNLLANPEDFLDIVRDYKKDYVLLGKTGTVELYHLSNDFEALKSNGYVPSQERMDTGGGSFAIGLYAYPSLPLMPTIKEFLRDKTSTMDGIGFLRPLENFSCLLTSHGV